MALSHSQYVDTRQSTFNNVLGNQTNQTFNITIVSSAPEWTLSSLDDVVQRPTSSPESVSQRKVHALKYHFEASSAGDIAIGLIVKIMQLLIVHIRSSDNHRDLKLELESLHQSLTLTGLAIQTYQHSPLGKNLAKNITPEVMQCRVALQELLNKVSGTWRGLNSTNISDLWFSVWWSRWEGDELASLRLQLSESRKSLDAILKALNSYVCFS
jgi:hypothetical protein